ncbi:MAG: hypothetical protein ACUVTU_01760 [Desulfurispora sp.]|uniref:hypothetical protein n=1 Tax=Desulfurispora sp. TaxID=3014275 RepID=UPI00404A8680
MTVELKTPYLVDELVVYLEGPQRARVIDTDCRWELLTTPDSCTCCTFRFGRYRQKDFACRHIKALQQVLQGSGESDNL